MDHKLLFELFAGAILKFSNCTVTSENCLIFCNFFSKKNIKKDWHITFWAGAKRLFHTFSVFVFRKALRANAASLTWNFRPRCVMKSIRSVWNNFSEWFSWDHRKTIGQSHSLTVRWRTAWWFQIFDDSLYLFSSSTRFTGPMTWVGTILSRVSMVFNLKAAGIFHFDNTTLKIKN